MANRPEAEIDLTEELVRELLGAQFVELSSEPLSMLARGWDNTIYRLGDSHLVRLPHREAAAGLILTEQRWLPLIAERVAIAIPAPTHAGVPTDTYPWHWSITPWFEGVEAAGAQLADPKETAYELGNFFAALHQPAPDDAPTNPYRGVPLTARRESFHLHLAKLPDSYDHREIAAVFDHAMAAPAADRRAWLHGDLHMRNMIVHDGELTAIIDWGDMGAGDRATDLAAAYMLVPDYVPMVRSYSGAGSSAWLRARGWAINFAVIYLANSDDDPVMRTMGERLLATVLAEELHT